LRRQLVNARIDLEGAPALDAHIIGLQLHRLIDLPSAQ
jgi:hypothetical protein